MRVPTVEVAVVLKAYATTSREAPKDYEDLFNLLSIAYAHREDVEAIGGWRLNQESRGSRGDAAGILRSIASRPRLSPALARPGVRPDLFAALVLQMVGTPSR